MPAAMGISALGSDRGPGFSLEVRGLGAQGAGRLPNFSYLLSSLS